MADDIDFEDGALGKAVVFAGILIGFTSVALVVTLMAWATAWLIQNFPNV